MRSVINRNVIIAALLIGTFGWAGAANAEVHFRSLSFSEARAAAAKEHKVVMIDFYTTWCGWCKVLDRNTYTDDNVTKITDAKFVCVKIDAEKGEGIDLAKQYSITGYPTILFFDEGGKEIDRVVGYEDASRFARSLETAAAGGSKAAVSEISGPHPTTDPAKWLIAANYFLQKNDRTSALAAFRKVIELDPENKQGQKEEAIFGVGFLSSGDEQVTTLEHAIEEFPTEVDADQANMLLIKHDFQTQHPEDAARRIDRWALKHPNDGPSFNFFAWAAAENGAVLDKADEYGQRAISLAPSPVEKASAMDTRAEVLYKMGKSSEASQLEASAIAMLDPVKDKKLYTELTEQKSKFDKALAAGSTAGTTNH